MASRIQREKRKRSRLIAESGPASITFAPVMVEITAAAGESLPTFQAIAYSGGKLYVRGFKQPVVVDLAGMNINDNATILLDHDSQKRVGHPDRISNDGRKLVVNGVISAETDYAKEVVESARNKFRWQMSIGARVEAAYEVAAGKVVTVNGQQLTGPLIVASKSKLNEISFVGSGGDEDNVVSIAAAAQGDIEMAKVNKGTPTGEQNHAAIDSAAQLSAEAVANPGTTDDAIVTHVATAVQAASNNGTPNADDAVQGIRGRAAGEVKRIAAIQKVFAGSFPDIEAKAIEDGWDEVKAELELMRAERDVTNTLEASGGYGPAIHSRRNMQNDLGDLTGKAIEASLCQQFGMSHDSAEKSYDEKVLELANSREFKSISLRAMMARSMAARGKHLGHGSVDGDTIVDFLTAEQELKAHAPGTFSTLSTAGILSNVANKMLLDSFTAVNTSIPTIFGRRNVRDFKTNTAYRLAMNGNLEEIPAGGEIKHADLEETSFTFAAKTWGKMLTLTRRDIINDDLGAFQQIPTQLGRKSALAIERQGWTLVLSNPGTFFGSGNANNQSGAGTALSIDSLTSAEQLFMDQKDSAGDPIMLSARYLVTGTAIASVATELMREPRIIMETVPTSAAKRIPASNPHAGKWTPIVSPFVNSQSLSGSSATVWYLFADPAEEAAFVISYLNGRDTPMIESSDLDFNHLGMSWRVVFDFGVDDHEPRAAVRSVGA